VHDSDLVLGFRRPITIIVASRDILYRTNYSELGWGGQDSYPDAVHRLHVNRKRLVVAHHRAVHNGRQSAPGCGTQFAWQSSKRGRRRGRHSSTTRGHRWRPFSDLCFAWNRGKCSKAPVAWMSRNGTRRSATCATTGRIRRTQQKSAGKRFRGIRF
jgi:hypothetical protein